MAGGLQRFTVKAGNFEVLLEKEADSFAVSLSAESLEEGLELVHLRLSSSENAIPGICRLSWSQPLVDIQAFWRPGTDRSRGLPADWGDSFISQSTTHAPAGCLFSQTGENRHTFAFSDALNPVEIKAGVNEETATFLFCLTLFQNSARFTGYEASLRLDTRPHPYYRTLEEVQKWWAGLPGYTPAPVPEPARYPMYSTWYSFHQRLVASEIEEECRIAREMGCRAVIVDDGWQTSNNERGYAYCGDWEVYSEKFPDMKAHVARVHNLGLKFLLWYAPPFVGPNSKTFKRFSGKYLNFVEHLNTWVLDPRFPEVREFLIGIFEKALREWGLDGFKIDFVQHFKQPPGENLVSMEARDCLSVPEATDRLLSDLLGRLTQLKPDIMVEFRQPYIGPLMRKYGNMFRAGDCPNDSLNNRVRTLDIRLLAGNSATHSDMLMWNSAEPVESAALQLLNVLFAVPQVSVRLKTLPPNHHKMLSFWLAWWQNHRELLLEGDLKPSHPELLYPVVEASRGEEQLLVLYAPVVARPSLPLRPVLSVINATLESALVLDFGSEFGKCSLETRNCTGELISAEEVQIGAGLKKLNVPPAGLLTLRASSML